MIYEEMSRSRMRIISLTFVAGGVTCVARPTPAILAGLFTVNMVVLFLHLYPGIMQSALLPPISVYYSSALKPEERPQMFDLLDILVREFQNANITYMMYGGTLLGAYRHHGQIPWDDDIDLLVNHSQSSKVWQVLGKLKPNYTLWTYYTGPRADESLTKFFKVEGDLKRQEYSWPFIDIFWFIENETHIWDADVFWSKSFIFPKEQVFPLQLRPFEKYNLPAPCDSRGFLSRNYNIDQCTSTDQDHRRGVDKVYFNVRVAPCKQLYDIFPFVFREDVEGGVEEYLRISHYDIGSRIIPNIQCIKPPEYLQNQHISANFSKGFRSSSNGQQRTKRVRL